VPREQIPGVEYVRCDVRDPIAGLPMLAEPEIYNFAAIHTTPGHEDWEYFWTNVLGALHVCNYATAVGCRSLIFTSSISVYGPSETPIDESGPFKPNSAYGRSKWQAEKIHRLWARENSARSIVIVRPAVVFGRGERGNFTRLAKQLKQGTFVYPGRKDTIKSCCYVEDLVDSIGFVRDLQRPETAYNFAYPQRYTTEDICKAFFEVAGYGVPKFVVPLPLLLVAGLGFEILSAAGLKTSINRARMMKLVNSTNIVPRVLEGLGYHFDTDIESGLRRWFADAPEGEFV
jgi:nucleoside-diphosphate-sugar epimerase